MTERHLLVLRHPETEANVTGRWVGRGDAPYTARGVAEHAALVEELVRFDPDVLWSSPLRRCREVAQTAAARLRITPAFDDRLLELDFGLAEGLTYEETVERGIRFEFKSESAPVAEGGESRRDILERTASALDDLLATEARRMAVVTHGGVFRSTVPHLLGLPMDSIWSFHIRNAAFLEYRIIDDHIQVERFGQVTP